ncbi:MAG: TetR family transcriptional regulator [Candidatus Sericytochromatia bacterium]|nr:MAG: TetR family transcriptional regulator [Candidatus Sericytochromatia bacterium]
MIISEFAKENKTLYLKDPESTKLGKRILSHSIILIDKYGFENFNFKKLAVAINSTEASIYRYFENKYKLLFYLISWYWSWIKSNIENRILNINDSIEKLKIVIHVIANSGIDDPKTPYINEGILSKIVIAEGIKSYITKNVEKDYKEGLFFAYKKLCELIASIILEVNPEYKYPKALTITLIRAAHKQLFFAEHLPDFTDIKINEDNVTELENFLNELIFSLLKK